MPGSPLVLHPGVSGLPFSGADYNDNLHLIENSFLDTGPWVISGLVVTVGSGLVAEVSAGVAVIGAELTMLAFSITGLTPSNVNFLYLQQNGSGTSNLTGIPPARSVCLGTATTGATTVNSVAMGRTSGRQQFVQPQNLIPGGPSAGTASAGHPDALNLANWALVDAEGKSCFGVLPAGAVTSASLPADVAYTDVANIFTHASGNTFKVSDAATNTTPALATFQHRTSGTPVSGFGAQLPFQFDNGVGTLTTFAQVRSMVTTPTAGAEDGALIFQVVHSGTLVETARARGVGMAPAGGFGGEWLNSGDFKHTGTKLGVFGATTVIQQANASQTAITAVTDANARSSLQAIYNLLFAYGLAPNTA